MTRESHTEIRRGLKQGGGQLGQNLRLRRSVPKFIRADGIVRCRGLDAASAGHTRRGMLGSSGHGAMVSAMAHGGMAARAAASAGAAVRRGAQCQTAPQRRRCPHAEH